MLLEERLLQVALGPAVLLATSAPLLSPLRRRNRRQLTEVADAKAIALGIRLFESVEHRDVECVGYASCFLEQVGQILLPEVNRVLLPQTLAQFPQGFLPIGFLATGVFGDDQSSQRTKRLRGVQCLVSQRRVETTPESRVG